MDLHPDFRDLLAAFVDSGASFVLVGGYAVAHHARPRATKDLDLLVSGQDENLARVGDALEKFGAPKDVAEAARRQTPTEVVYLGVPPVRIDILRSADGIDTDTVIARAVAVDLDGLVVPVIALADLIANKRASGRKQDIADVALLERVRSRRDP